MNHRDRLAITTFKRLPDDEILNFGGILIEKLCSDEIVIQLAGDESKHYVGSPEHCDDCKQFWYDHSDLWDDLVKF